MKRINCIWIILVLFSMGIAPAFADLNEEISFTNDTSEPLYIELYVEDDYDWAFYDLYVERSECSYASFWTDRPYSAYSVCAYGEITDDFYGCIEGEIIDYDTHITFDYTGYPYRSSPPLQTCDTYYYDTADSAAEVVFASHDDDDDVYVSCFIGAMAAFE